MAKPISSMLAIVMLATMAGCSAPQPASADFPWAAKPVAAPGPASLEEGQSRLPLATDFGVAWDQVAHRADRRWICRATPSGKVVMTSLCDGRAKEDTRWPGLAAPEHWDGLVHTD